MNGKQIYHPPREIRGLPPELVGYFDGRDLRGRIGEAIGLNTVGEDGWPHAALLSVGEILAVDSENLRLVMSPGSTTTRNIERTGRVTLSLVHGNAFWEIRLAARREGDAAGVGHNSAIFVATVELVRIHEVPYARVESGVSYQLNDPDAVVERWEQQILVLRSGI
ncbi:hypothetical protein [Paraburkholderia tropica]|uniref:hypothetical protein n=1 Tax=Paraburkholderia tropica TaxID=92647 RepID=UPI002AB6554D|nr:hypothetical protein [Paraburkholderia tropica]